MLIKLNHKIAGGFQIIISSYWIFRNLSILYDYRAHTDMLRLFWIPDWILFVQAIIGLIGIVIGILVFKGKMKVRNGYLIFGLAWLIGFTSEIIL